MNASLPAATLWSQQQQQWLAALGHALYLPAGEPAPGPAAARDAVPVAAMPSPARAPERTARAGLIESSAAAAPDPGVEAPARSRAAPPAPASRRPSRLPDKLHFALIRASGCNPNAAGAAEIFAQWPPAAELRGNPAAKRALWPALRALRAGATAPR